MHWSWDPLFSEMCHSLQILLLKRELGMRVLGIRLQCALLLSPDRNPSCVCCFDVLKIGTLVSLFNSIFWGLSMAGEQPSQLACYSRAPDGVVHWDDRCLVSFTRPFTLVLHVEWWHQSFP